MVPETIWLACVSSYDWLYKPLCEFTDETLEWKFPDEDLGALLVTSDLTESDGSGPISVRCVNPRFIGWAFHVNSHLIGWQKQPELDRENGLKCNQWKPRTQVRQLIRTRLTEDSSVWLQSTVIDKQCFGPNYFTLLSSECSFLHTGKLLIVEYSIIRRKDIYMYMISESTGNPARVDIQRHISRVIHNTSCPYM